MGLFRLLLLFLLGYLFIKFIKRLLTPKPPNPHVKGGSDKPGDFRNRDNIQDIDYEEIDKE
jgi:hypothetical protein